MLEQPPRRVRFLECQLERSGERVRARVDLAAGDDRTVTGTAERAAAEDADLWCAAEATAAGLREALGLGTDGIVLKEVLLFAIEGKPAVAVSLRATVDGLRRRLFGLTQAEEDRVRAAALSVLNATNRFLTKR